MPEEKKDKVKWYFTKKALVIGLLAVGPFAIPLLWLNPQYTVKAKIIWTVVAVAATIALGAVSSWAYETLMTLLGFQGA